MAGVGGDFAPSVAGEEFVDDRGGDGFFQVLGETTARMGETTAMPPEAACSSQS